MNTEIYFRRATSVAVSDNESSPLHFPEVAAFDANLRKLGYTLSGELAERLLSAPVGEIARLHNEVIAAAKQMKGVRNYQPMYPNFPEQVMKASEAELYVNAILHYFGDAIGVRIMPEYAKLARPELTLDDLEIIKLGSAVDFNKLMSDLLSSKSAFSETDRNDIAALSDEDFSLSAAYVSEFKNRENKAFYGAQTLKREFVFHGAIFDTATDVLRLAVAMSDGDISLAENTTFRNFKRPERRLLLGLLNEVFLPVEDMLRHEAAWKRLGERLHPGEFGQFSNAQVAFAAVRENAKFESFNAKVEKALAEGNLDQSVALLKTRPGEFARRLDHVLRISGMFAGKLIVKEFAEVAKDVSPTVLVQLRNQMLNREGKRVFFPKGSIAKMQIAEDSRPELPLGLRLSVARVCSEALIAQFRDRGNLGKVFIDPALKKIAIPFGQRSASKAVKTLGRGSRLPLENVDGVVRFFIWWKDAVKSDSNWGGRVDIDLSAVALDENLKSVFDVTYYNLRELGAVHSGDITSAPDGASEFIDIDIEKARGMGARYVAMTLHSYSGQNFDELPECFAGFMERKSAGSGEIYEPATVKNKVDVTAKSKGATPFIFDLETGEAIWVDLTMTVKGAGHNVHSTKRTISDVLDAMVNLTPPNLYDLFVIHAIARGELVEDRAAAEKVYALDGDVTPFDTEDILANYL